MKFAVIIYNDPAMLDQLAPTEFNSTMRGCIEHAEEMRKTGVLIDSQMLQPPSSARSIRLRNGRQSVMDGPFAETKEVLGGFNIIEAENMDEAVRIASEFPWSATGCVEVREVIDIADMKARVNAA